MIWIISITVCAGIGAAFGALVNTRAFGGANWIPTYTVLGILWGVYTAFNYTGDKARTKGKGELLTETKEYNKKFAKKRKKSDR